MKIYNLGKQLWIQFSFTGNNFIRHDKAEIPLKLALNTKPINQMMFVSFNSTMTGVTSGAGIGNPSRAPEITPGF